MNSGVGVGCWYVIFAGHPDSPACWVCLNDFRYVRLALCPQSVSPKAFSDSVRKVWPDSRRAQLLPGNLSAPKSYPSWEHCYSLRAEGCQKDLEQSSEELIKRKQVTVSSNLLKKMVNSVVAGCQWFAVLGWKPILFNHSPAEQNKRCQENSFCGINQNGLKWNSFWAALWE